MNDNQFATTLMTIIGVLIALTVFLIIMANILNPGADYTDDNLIQGSVEERIKPIGALALDGDAPVNATESDADTVVAGNDASASKSPAELYTACAACHDAGVLNAPKLGDKAGWSDRLGKGVEALYTGAINGIGAMPAKGGRADYSDEDIKLVVDYMLESVK